LQGQSRQQNSHASHIAVILAGLVGTAQDHLFDQGRVQIVTFHECLKNQGSQVIWPDGGQSPAQVTDRGAQCVNDHSLWHGEFLLNKILA
jgi:hypothetical protein